MGNSEEKQQEQALGIGSYNIQAPVKTQERMDGNRWSGQIQRGLFRSGNPLRVSISSGLPWTCTWLVGFLGGFLGSVLVILIIIKRSGYARHFDNARSGGFFTGILGLSLGFVIVVGLFEGLFVLRMWIFPIAALLLLVGLSYKIKKG